MNRKAIAYLLLTASLHFASPALADPPVGHGHGHGKGHDRAGHDEHDDNDKDRHHGAGHFRDKDRLIVTDYMAEEYHRSCPPGLAKKHNGCLPPGQAKKLYSIGHPLPAGLWHPLPQPLLARLEPMPGYQYVMVDKDVLLVSEASHKVIDAVTLLSAVGR